MRINYRRDFSIILKLSGRLSINIHACVYVTKQSGLDLNFLDSQKAKCSVILIDVYYCTSLEYTKKKKKKNKFTV